MVSLSNHVVLRKAQDELASQTSTVWRSHSAGSLPSRRAGSSYIGSGERQKLISLYWLSHMCMRMMTAILSGSALKCWCQDHFDTSVASPAAHSWRSSSTTL